MDLEYLAKVFLWFLSGGGAGAAVAWLFENIAWLKSWVEKFAPEGRRLVTIACSGVFGILAFLGQCAMLYAPWPVTPRSLIEHLVAAFAMAAVVGQVVHGRMVLAQRSARL